MFDLRMLTENLPRGTIRPEPSSYAYTSVLYVILEVLEREATPRRPFLWTGAYSDHVEASSGINRERDTRAIEIGIERDTRAIEMEIERDDRAIEIVYERQRLGAIEMSIERQRLGAI